MKNKETIGYAPAMCETYHRNIMVNKWDDLIHLTSEGIMIIYKGNIFDLEEYWEYDVDDKGNPIN